MNGIFPLIASSPGAAGGAASDLNHLIGEGVELMIVGMGVVFSALVLVGLVMVVLRLVAADKQPAAKPSAAAASAAAKTPAEPAITPELIAVLAAAATVAVGRPARVSRVRFVSYTPGHAWTERGRTTVQSSYPVRKSVR
ncbi:MAG: OadG family protein [Rhodocyclaceae bacterium]|nr:OadG family protein [Rhodocyclaceae bacterium]